MARLTQSNSAVTNTSAINAPPATRTASPNVQNAVTPAATIRPKKRRYPRWFTLLRAFAILLTVGQFGYKAATGGMEFARSYGWRPAVKHALPNDTSFAVAPQGDKYLVGYRSGSDSHMKLYKSSGELLWSGQQLSGNPVFSADGTQIFSGTEAREATTGKVIARIPAQKEVSSITWSAQGSHAVWKSKEGIQVWERATNKIRSIVLPKGYSTSNTPGISPNGKWLAASIYTNKEGQKCSLALWNLATSQKPELYAVGSNAGQLFGLAFSPDSRKLLYAGYDYTHSGKPNKRVNIWTLGQNQSVEFYSEHSAYVAVWAPDGKHFALRGGLKWSVYDAGSARQVWGAHYRANSVSDDIYFTKDNKLYFYDSFQEGWSLEYWDLTKALTRRGGN